MGNAAEENVLLIHSFDVFDTIITRKCASPEGIYALVQQELMEHYQHLHLPSDFVKNFVYIRSHCALKARLNAGYDITFDEIYDYIGNIFGIKRDVLKKVQEIEIQTEYSNMLPVSENIAQIENLINNKEKVIFLSDMYFPKETIMGFIRRFSNIINNNNVDVWVSAEHKANKWDGQIFNIVSSYYNIQPENIIHTGDNIHADVEMPKKHGWQTIYSTYIKDNYISHYLLEGLSDNTAVQNYAGALKYLEYKSGNMSDGYYTGVFMASIVLYSYVSFVINDALKKGIKKLFFLSRDGDILRQIAEIIAAESKMDIELKYLHVSRHGIISSSYYELDENRCFDFVILNCPDVTLKEIAARLLIPLDKLLAYAKANGKNWDENTKVTFDMAGFIRWLVVAHSELKTISEENSRKQRESLLEYLKNENAYGADTAYVDIGWNGSIQDTIYYILEKENINTKLHGYYFGVSNYTLMHSENNQKTGYAFNPYSPCNFNHEVLRLLEIFCHTNQPVVQGYKDNKPVFDVLYTDENKAFVEEMQKGILYASRFYAKNYKFYNMILNNNGIIRYLHLLDNPDTKMAEAVGEYMHIVGTLDYLKYKTAPKDNLLQAVLRKYNKKQVMWTAGYKQRLSKSGKIAAALKSSVKNIINIMKG